MKNKIFPHTFWRPFLDCMPQLFFRPKYVWFPIHLKGPMIPDPSGQLAELIVYITSTRVDLYSHQILLQGPPCHSPRRWKRKMYGLNNCSECPHKISAGLPAAPCGLLYSLNHFRIWRVSPHLSFGDTCQIWTWYSIGNQCTWKCWNVCRERLRSRSTHPGPCPQLRTYVARLR